MAQQKNILTAKRRQPLKLRIIDVAAQHRYKGAGQHRMLQRVRYNIIIRISFGVNNILKMQIFWC